MRILLMRPLSQSVRIKIRAYRRSPSLSTAIVADAEPDI